MKVEYSPPGRVAQQYLVDDSFVVGIRGPIGSGKSTASVMKLIRNCRRQPPGPDGVARRRTAIVRNTYPELKTTTIKTWHQWVPQTVGKWVSQGPPTHHIKTPTLDWEVIFLALDSPEDINKLLSLELSDAWINEAREVPKAVLDGLTGRVGRYPAVRDGGCHEPQIILDTNPPDTDHWWYRLAEEERPEGWTFYAQPGGRSEHAENLANLPESYYRNAVPGKRAVWVDVYIDGKYGYVADTKPVYPEFYETVHVREFALERGPLRIGLDFGLTPAATIGRRLASGRWVIDREVVTTRMGVQRFADELKGTLSEHYQGWPVELITGDPAGNQGQAGDKDERTVFEILEGSGVSAVPAYTNDFSPRVEVVSRLLSSIIDGEPGLLIHPRCTVLKKAMAGKYHFKRVQVTGDERYQDKPNKNEFSHVAEALQYNVLGLSDGMTMLLAKQSSKPLPVTDTGLSVWL